MIIWKTEHPAREHGERLRIRILAEVRGLHTKLTTYNSRIYVPCDMEVQ